ncbi:MULTISPECIES: glycerophosphodiester phosphodiesterase family protein [unclassified Ruegeria]|uniref:glycerophosphodiester phosphodiesterase family protein n=1 Tax=unclassified Ruegeria TaxID=2625375 RepID=UPI001ADAA8A4|nr:glycerophosphodiester phosphodiesterase [Ruegeria sp. R8_1]MBO9415838.1 glycerophosphodiester phosphodiesterase [Ruegeria sp. R8_2]
MSLFSAGTTSYRGAWARRRVFVPIYLAVRLLLVALIAPGVALTVNLAVSLSNQTALTDQAIAAFVLSPVGFVAAVVVLSLFLLAEVLVFSVMAASLRMGERDPWRAGSSAIGLILSRLPALFGFAVRFVLRVLLLVVPFAAVAAVIAWWTLTEYDINYYLTFRPPSFLVAVGLIGAVVLVMAWVLIRRLSAWALGLHLVLFESVAPASAFNVSATRMEGKRGRLKLELAIWLGLRIVIAALIATVAGLLFDLVPLQGASHLKLALIYSLIVAGLWSLAGLVLAATALGALAVLLDGFFEIKTSEPPHPEPGNLRVPLLAAVGGAAVAVVAGLWVGQEVLDRVDAPDRAEVIGHRGAAALRPENTMAAVLKAIEDGADWVEIDVQESADDVVIVAHDSDFMKLAGVPTKVWDATMEDVAEIDIGSWFDPEYADERTPTLRQVLEAAKGKAKVIIELKYYGHDVDLENRVAALVEEFEMQDDIATMSLKYPAVQKMEKLRPDWRAGVLAATAVGDLSGLEGEFVAVNAGMATPGLVRSVQAAGKDIYVWTVNDPLQMSAMASMGVDGLITDDPALANEVLRIRAEMGPAERLLLWLATTFGMSVDKQAMRDASP